MPTANKAKPTRPPKRPARRTRRGRGGERAQRYFLSYTPRRHAITPLFGAGENRVVSDYAHHVIRQATARGCASAGRGQARRRLGPSAIAWTRPRAIRIGSLAHSPSREPGYRIDSRNGSST